MPISTAGSCATNKAILPARPKTIQPQSNWGVADTVALNSRGHAFRRLNRYGDALGDYGEAIRLEPDNVAALVGRGDTYCDIGQYGEAAKDYRAAVEANPRLGRAYRGAAWLMATCPDQHYRNEKLAIEAARKALDLDGDTDFRDLETLAAAQANAGLFAEAKATQERAIAQAPQSQRVQSEKLMALYQREQPYRETPVTAFAHPEDEPEHPVRKASATGPLRPARRHERTASLISSQSVSHRSMVYAAFLRTEQAGSPSLRYHEAKRDWPCRRAHFSASASSSLDLVAADRHIDCTSI